MVTCFAVGQVVELDPISVDDAIEAMEAIGHDFYVFRCVCVCAAVSVARVRMGRGGATW